MYFHKTQEKPRIWGSFQDRQYSIWRNLEDIYQVDHESEILIMPLFWGLPPWNYSNNTNHGTNHGSTHKDGSLGFDGDDYVLSPHNSILNSYPITLSTRIKTTDSSFGRHGIISKYTTFNGYDLFVNSGNLRSWYIKDGSNYVYDGGEGLNGGSVADGDWHNIIFNVDISGGELFVDGISRDTMGWTGTPGAITTTNSVRIGFKWSNNIYFTGLIDEIRISSIVYTADQIALFHDRPWDLYRPVSRPIYSLPTLPVENPLWYYDMIGRQ